MIILFLTIDLIGGIFLFFSFSSLYSYIFLFLYLIINIISWKFLIKLFSLRINCVKKQFFMLIKESIKKAGYFCFLLLMVDVFIDVFMIDFYIIQITHNIFILFFISFILSLAFLTNKVFLVLLL
jgi:hypothetical protein